MSEPRVLSPEEIARDVLETVSAHTMGSARSQQSAEQLIGISEVGACRNYLRHMVIQTPYDEPEDVDPKWPAFVGSAVGERAEEAYAARDDLLVRNEVPLTATLPSGLAISGSSDTIRDRKNLIDWKTADGLATVRRGGSSFQRKAQLNTYLLAAIQQDIVDEDACGHLVYLDRSGREAEPVVHSSPYDPEITAQVDERLGDVIYAVQHGEEASRDEPYEWCKIACPFFSKCRGQELHESGVIEDEEAIQAVKNYRAGLEMEKEGKRLKDESKQRLVGVSGAADGFMVSWTTINEAEIAATRRAAYERLNIRKITRRS